MLTRSKRAGQHLGEPLHSLPGGSSYAFNVWSLAASGHCAFPKGHVRLALVVLEWLSLLCHAGVRFSVWQGETCSCRSSPGAAQPSAVPEGIETNPVDMSSSTGALLPLSKAQSRAEGWGWWVPASVTMPSPHREVWGRRTSESDCGNSEHDRMLISAPSSGCC